MASDLQPDCIDRSVVDFGVLADWMDAQGLPAGPITGVKMLPGGTKNVLLRLVRGPGGPHSALTPRVRGGEEYVLRPPPPHLRERSNEALRREARVLAALGATN